jgi:hypothetical protein
MAQQQQVGELVAAAVAERDAMVNLEAGVGAAAYAGTVGWQGLMDADELSSCGGGYRQRSAPTLARRSGWRRLSATLPLWSGSSYPRAERSSTPSA